MARDVIAEILGRKSRLHPRGARWERFNRRIMPIMTTSAELRYTKRLSANAKIELCRYFPIAVIAALEGYFRLVYADLINHGSPYSERINKFRDMKFGPEIIAAIHGRRITGGELIAHLLLHNSFADIDANMTVLLGESFQSALGTNPFGAMIEASRNFMPPLIQKIEETFRLRHTFCHELATKVKLSPSRGYELCRASIALTLLTDMLVSELLGKRKKMPVIRMK